MSANDNAMTRFLFAILKQKCLKDIDWNQVAHDPILAQEITNGHAARMRYSRFRSAMLGLEPQRRNRTNPNKSRVSKSKKEGKTSGSTKKEESAVKAETATALQTEHQPVKDERKPSLSPSSPLPKVKQEILRGPAALIDPPASVALASLDTISVADTQFHTRLLTPCSDTDFFTNGSPYTASPASDLLPSDASFDFGGPTSAHCSHEPSPWMATSAYSPYGVDYDLSALQMSLYEHQPVQHGHDHSYDHVPDHSQGAHFQQEQLCIRPAAMMGPDAGSNVFGNMVKHEDWDAQRYH